MGDFAYPTQLVYLYSFFLFFSVRIHRALTVNIVVSGERDQGWRREKQSLTFHIVLLPAPLPLLSFYHLHLFPFAKRKMLTCFSGSWGYGLLCFLL